MGNIGWIQIAIVVVLVVLLFGRGKISDLMGDVASGIKNFREGIAEDEPSDTPTDVADASLTDSPEIIEGTATKTEAKG
jgi:sec-independent protein translocase protein TatA